MKPTITFLFLLFSLSLLAQEEIKTNYEIQYEIIYKIDSTNLEKTSTEIVYLYSNSKESVFLSYPEAFKEEIKEKLMHQLKTTNQLNISKEYSSNFPKTFYKNLASGKVQTLEKIDSKKYIYQEPNSPISWKIEEDHKEIMDFSVQKATTHFAGRDYIAWFTTEIPISDGPYIFSGLPGLIVELYDTQDHYHFTLKEVKRMKTERVFEIPEAEEIAKADFLKLQEKARKNSEHNMMNLPGIQMKIVTTDDMSQEQKMDNQAAKRKIKETKLSKNNPIELNSSK